MKTKVGKVHATAEIFWIAFSALRKAEQHAVVDRLVSNKEFREDLLDLAVLEKRRSEPSRPFRNYLQERSKKKA